MKYWCSFCFGGQICEVQTPPSANPNNRNEFDEIKNLFPHACLFENLAFRPEVLSVTDFSGLSRCVREEGGYGDYEEEGQQPVPRTALTLVPTEGHPAPKAILAGCLLEVSVQGDTIMTLINLIWSC